MKKGIVMLLVVMLSVFSTMPALASVPYMTFSEDAGGNEVLTQTTFQPIGRFQQDEALVNPENLFIDESNHLFVADSGTKSIHEYDANGVKVAEYGLGELVQPTGIFVASGGDLYVADYGASTIVQLNRDNEIIRTYEKPDSPLFGERGTFKPKNVVLDRRGNLYVISEGSTNGIIQLSENGEFLGYYGINRTQNAVGSVVRDVLSIDMGMFQRNPPAPQNIEIDQQGLIYSITQGAEIEKIKKLNVAGDNMLPVDIVDKGNFVDLTVDQYGNMFALEADGTIYEFDSFGNFLFSFSGPLEGSNQWGLSQQASSITVDSNGYLYVADRERGLVQTFAPTAFMNEVHAGISLFKEGLYVESREYWENVLNLNASFSLAHTAMGRAYFKEQQYDAALEQYTLAEDRQSYSDAFWEMRHRWLQGNLGLLIGILLIAILVWYSVKFADRKARIISTAWEKRPQPKWFTDLTYVTYFIKHPIDGFYYIRKGKRGSVLSATILYAVLILFYFIWRMETGFIFSSVTPSGLSLGRELLTITAPIGLFLIANYLVSTINDGQGKLRDIYIGTIYALMPFLVFIVPVTLVSNVITLNEAFLYTYSVAIIAGWSAILLYFMVKEIHRYEIGETFKNLLITLFAMVLLVLVGFILYVLLNQVVDFVYSIVNEVMMRV